MDWHTFKQHYHKELNNPANHGYELKFVELILQNIPNLSPSDVIPQYHFKDRAGKSRYIDFMIINESKNWLLPIELDGYAKMVGNGEEYYRFNDFLERQNALISKFGLVLRYSNKAVLNQSRKIITEISDMLNKQNQIKEKERSQWGMAIGYEQKIRELNVQKLKVEQLEKELQQLRTKYKSNDGQSKSTKSFWLILMILFLIIDLIGGYWLFKQQYLDIFFKPREISRICGTVAQVKTFKGYAHLNLGSSYPNQTMTLVTKNYQGLEDLIGHEVCTHSDNTIGTLKDKPIVTVNSLEELDIK